MNFPALVNLIFRTAIAAFFALITINHTSATADEIQNLELNVFLKQWNVLGPFPKASKESNGIDEEFFAREADVQAGFARLYRNRLFTWRTFDTPMVEFRRVFETWGDDGDNVVAYAYTEFISPQQQELLLGIGHDDEVRGWLNGQEFCHYAERTSAITDSKLERVSVQKGVNRLLLKVGQGTTGWEVAARFRPLEIDAPLLTFRCDPSDRPDRNPDFDVTLLDAQNRPLASHRCGGFRTSHGAEGGGVYSLYAPMPSVQPASVLLTSRPNGMKPVEETHSWSEIQRRQTIVKLEASSPIKLRILDSQNGKPIPGARASVDNVGLSEGVANASGIVSVNDVSPMQWRMFAVAEGYVAKVVYPDFPYGKVQTIKLPRGGKTLRGSVVDAAGKPLAGASIGAGYSNDYQPAVQTDERGEFEIFGLAQNLSTLDLTLSCDGFVTRANVRPILKDKGPTEVQWMLSPAATLTGIVVDAKTGEPVADAKVTVGTDRFGRNNPETRTDSEGRYLLSSLNSGSAVVNVISSNFAPTVETVVVKATQQVTANFQLEAGKSVTGVVADSKGKPISGVHLVCDTWNSQRMFDRDAYTDVNGRFELPHMPSTAVEVHVLKREFVSKRDLMVTGGETVNLKLRPIVNHQVTVRDAATEALVPGLTINQGYRWDANREVSWQSSRYYADRYFNKLTGELKFPTNESNSYNMLWRFRATGYVDEIVEVPQDSTEGMSVDVKLRRAPTFVATVVEKETGKPLRDVAVALVTQEDRLRSNYVEYRSLRRYLDDGHFTGRYAVSDGSGRVKLSVADDPEATAIALVAKDGANLLGLFSDLAPGVTGTVADRTGELPGNAATIELQFPKSGTLRGRLTQADQPLVSDLIHLRKINTTEGQNVYRAADYRQWFGVSGQLTTDADGQFDFGGLGPGTYQLHRSFHFDFPGGQSSQSIYLTSKTITLASGEDGVVNIALPAGQTVSAKVVEKDGAPAAGCLVKLEGGKSQGTYAAAKSDSDGNVQFANIPAGTWTITMQQYVSNGQYSYQPTTTGTTRVEVDDERVSVEIKLAPAKPAEAPSLLNRVFDFFGQ